MPVVTPPLKDDFDLAKANAAANAGDTYTTDANGDPVRDVPRSEEELMKPWEERAAVIRASILSP